MAKRQAEYLTKTLLCIIQEQIEKLKRILPECVTEGKVDFDLLRATLGDAEALAGEDGAAGAYTLTWAGKQEAFRGIQIPSGESP